LGRQGAIRPEEPRLEAQRAESGVEFLRRGQSAPPHKLEVWGSAVSSLSIGFSCILNTQDQSRPGSWVIGSNRSLFWMGHVGHRSVDVDP